MRAEALWRGRQRGEAGLGGRLPEALLPAALSRCWSLGRIVVDHEAIGLRCDLDRPVSPTPADLPLTVIEIDGRELGDLLAEKGERGRAAAALACPLRRRLALRRIGRCFVAMTSGAEPCFVQWLLDHTHNQALRHGFGDAFPHLLRDEALLEGAFTLAPCNAGAIEPVAMARIAARAARLGVRWVHRFVPAEDAAALRATIAAGFAIHQRRVQRRRLWRLTTSYGPLPLDFRLPAA